MTDDVVIRIIVDVVLIIVVAVAAWNTYQLRQANHRQTAEAAQRREAAYRLCTASNDTRRVLVDVLADAERLSPPAAKDFYQRNIDRVHLTDCRPFHA